jgi:hypothetical protein
MEYEPIPEGLQFWAYPATTRKPAPGASSSGQENSGGGKVARRIRLSHRI